jgi:hypothetical protein
LRRFRDLAAATPVAILHGPTGTSFARSFDRHVHGIMERRITSSPCCTAEAAKMNSSWRGSDR